MSIIINVLCFSAGAVFGLVFLSLFVAAGRADERDGLK